MAFLKLESPLELKTARRKFSYNPGHNKLELPKFLVQVKFATRKRNFISSLRSLVWVARRVIEWTKT